MPSDDDDDDVGSDDVCTDDDDDDDDSDDDDVGEPLPSTWSSTLCHFSISPKMATSARIR